jgi:hypothetical protein
MNRFRTFITLLVITLSIAGCRVKFDTVELPTFEERLQALFPGAEITSIAATDHFTRAYQLVLKQPLDHKDRAAGTFDHYVYLSHTGFQDPTVIVTEGYDAKPRTYELTELFRANQVQVEYRFYGKSRPDSIPWKYLRNDQAVEDYHKIITRLRRLYTGKWISTGISKGGETVLIHKARYPWDVEVAVPYVAPLIDTQEDPRTDAHIRTIGSESCRTAIERFQRLVLENRDGVLEEMMKYAEAKSMSFTEIPYEEALEYAVLEYPFSFWQWGGNCETIPDASSSPKALFEALNGVVGIGFYNDKTYFDLLPSYYQHMVELGYYGFDTEPVKDLLRVVHHPTNKRFAPKGVDLTYDPDYIKRVRDYAEHRGNKILYIYGEFDTWGACAPQPEPHVDALKMVLEKGSHRTRIKHFPQEDKERIYETLRRWLGYRVTLYPPEQKEFVD